MRQERVFTTNEVRNESIGTQTVSSIIWNETMVSLNVKRAFRSRHFRMFFLVAFSSFIYSVDFDSL